VRTWSLDGLLGRLEGCQLGLEGGDLLLKLGVVGDKGEDLHDWVRVLGDARVHLGGNQTLVISYVSQISHHHRPLLDILVPITIRSNIF